MIPLSHNVEGFYLIMAKNYLITHGYQDTQSIKLNFRNVFTNLPFMNIRIKL